MGMLFVFNPMIQCELHHWSARGKDDAFWTAYCGRYLLLLLWSNSWLEICNSPPALSLFGIENI